MRGRYWRESPLTPCGRFGTLGDWQKQRAAATRFTEARARSYLRDWASYGATVEKVRS